MARIPLPERGQPLDVSYIYQLANALNELATQISPATNKYVTVDTQNNGKQSVKASEARIIGANIPISITTTTAGTEKDFSYDFPNDFKYAPIATATVVNIGNTSSGKNVSISLTTVNTSKIEGVIKFNSTGDLTIAVNIIIVGIPN